MSVSLYDEKKRISTQCAASVWSQGGWRTHQCRRTGRLEHDNILFCSTHYPPYHDEREKKRDDAARAKWAAEDRRRKIGYMGPAYIGKMDEIRKFIRAERSYDADLLKLAKELDELIAR